MFAEVRQISISKLRAGYICATDVRDDSQRVLLAAGTRLTTQFIQHLRNRGISHLTIGVEDYSRLFEEATESSAQTGKLASSKSPVNRHRRVDRRREPHCASRARRFSEQMNKSLHLIDDIGSNGLNFTKASIQELNSVPTALVEMLVEDTDQAILAVKSESLLRLSTRMARMAVLASGLALELDMTREDIALVGQAAVLHDIGLFVLPEEIRDHSQRLNEQQQAIYRGHPRLAVEMLAECHGSTEAVKLLVMQVHELADGSGFPRGLPRHRQHPLAKILSLVEVYLALTSPGPNRLPLIPHDAIRLMLYQCRQGLLDSNVMRAFINQHSLFPLGSEVELDDTTRALTARRDGEDYDMPIVAPANPIADEYITLKSSSRRVVRPLCNSQREMRLPKETPRSAELAEFIYC